MADESVFVQQINQTGLKQNLDNLQAGPLDNSLSLLGNSRVDQAGSLPWKSLKLSRFFHYVEIDPDRWDQLFPYRLLVIETNPKKGGVKVVNGTPTSQITVTGGSNSQAIVNFQPLGRQWVFTLPISPQQLSITDQFAINTSATLRGVLEEHGGAKFKLISAAGTMGVWPYRSSISSPPQSPGILQSVFGGTIEAANNLVGQVNRVINIATTNHPANKPVSKRPEASDAGNRSTGYYQAMAFQQFLEQYAEAKKNPANAGWRLVFDIPKQNQSFVVTPMQFVWQQSVNKPLEVLFNLQMKAWRRVDLQEKISATQPSIQSISPGILQRILGVIDEARKATSAAVNLIGAVRSDVEKPLDILRQTSLFVRDLAGAIVSAADLPFQLQRDYASAIKDSLNNLSSTISSTSSDPSVRSALAAIGVSAAAVEGISLLSVQNGQIGQKASSASTIDPANNVFSQPERNYALIDQAPVSSLTLTDAQQATVDNTINDIRSITVDDLKQFRATMLELALQLSNSFGAGAAFYNKVYGRPAPTPRIQPMTLDEYDLLQNIYQTIQSYDILTSTTDIDDANKQTNMEYVAGLADTSGIDFSVPNSKILAPVPFGLNIEQIALRYLGDAQRWLEIATLNNLRDPYIDENGFQLPLLSNASGRQITISNIDNLYIGQRVVLQSATQQPSARRILSIDRLSDTSFLLSLDGESNLDNFIIADKAYLQAYLPGTVNSQQKIFIPSLLPVPNDPNIIPPASTQGDPLTGLSKVDLLLTDTGDLAVNTFGDFRFAYGMTNIIQALKIKIGTPRGKVITHPEFGLGIQPGTISSDLNVQDIFNSLNKLIEEDPRFAGINSMQIQLNGPTMTINMGVALAGQSGVFPVTFELPT